MALSELVLASNNPGKSAEMGEILAEMGINVISQRDFNTPEAKETANTFVENALIKARNAAAYSGRTCLADDSGLCVDALEGEPGVRSARYAGPDASDQDNVDKLLKSLADRKGPERRARFVCLMVCLRRMDDPLPLIAMGEWTGHIAEGPRGEGGFGYDPIFIPDGDQRTAAELPKAEKNRISHRGQALAQMQQALLALKQG
ncbi:XTP/dITP diphosphohydrolase [Natronospira proteinivora]|uniref:dITP/XTP pyrophosphatase n=1 Tax=Natronospira proteinivora TaxID=1807133 RepID=A0ABT1G9I1_9GAMM|nr:RdgB/HAM1 family non-canonical purine NTP pyrophosphatase [Natronospira proteinivora]MCP1727979.1 XTP/dITP diphosphohydrolase [Natronospira proteinivora]